MPQEMPFAEVSEAYSSETMFLNLPKQSYLEVIGAPLVAQREIEPSDPPQTRIG